MLEAPEAARTGGRKRRPQLLKPMGGGGVLGVGFRSGCRGFGCFVGLYRVRDQGLGV